MAVREEATEVPAREAAVKAGMPVPSIEVRQEKRLQL